MSYKASLTQFSKTTEVSLYNVIVGRFLIISPYKLELNNDSKCLPDVTLCVNKETLELRSITLEFVPVKFTVPSSKS